MATQTLIKHGTMAGYREELKTDNVCERCRKASRQYNKQYSRPYKAKGIKYGLNQVIDHLYKPGKSSVPPARTLTEPTPTEHVGSPVAAGEPLPDPGMTEPNHEVRGLGDRLSDALKGFTLTAEKRTDSPYVETDEIPDYLNQLPADPEPSGDGWSKVKEDEFLITSQGMELIEENMGTYLSVISMTLALIDPYCAPNDDEIFELVKRWSKVVARYPKAAKLFMSEGSGVIMDWIGAIQVTWPILFRIYQHHLSGEVKTVDGRPMRVHKSSNGQRPDIDATMPPMPDTYEYTVGTN